MVISSQNELLDEKHLREDYSSLVNKTYTICAWIIIWFAVLGPAPNLHGINFKIVKWETYCTCKSFTEFPVGWEKI